MKFVRIILCVALLGMGPMLQAKVKLPSLVGDNMVLQQNTQINLWGWSEPNAKITASPSWGRTVTTKADNQGKWLMKVTTPKASLATYTITISDGQPVTLRNIQIGEVWFCGGQSNMDHEVQGGRDCPIENAQDIIVESAQYPHIHLFRVKLDGGDTPKEDVTGSWQMATPDVVKQFSAVGYLFGLNLNKALHIPIGIIVASCGGTWIETWFPDRLQHQFADYDPASYRRKNGNGMNTTESLYNGMIYPAHNYTIKGFCWYQGCTNVGRSTCYADKMVALITHWREIFGGDAKPFYYVEICPFDGGEDNLEFAYVREQQAKVLDMIENVGMVCTNDLIHEWETGNIHPSQKIPVAKRLAYWALSRDYGFGEAIKTIGPRFKSMEVLEGGVVKVSFEGSDCGFVAHGAIPGFELAGANGEFHPAQAVRRRPDATVLYVSCYDIGNPVYIRYNFKNCSVGKLWDAFGQPVVPFRNDTF